MKIKKIFDAGKMKKFVAVATVFAFICSQTGFAQMIVLDGNTDTVMDIGQTTDIYANTNSGKTGFNSFQKFNVAQMHTVNLQLQNKEGTKSYENLVNMVTGNEMSRIDGTLNAFKNGKIGGNVFFLNPNGIMIGAGGVVNVGALTLATPSIDYINRILSNVNDFSGSFNGDTFSQAVLAGDVPINASGRIAVKGRINAYYGATLHGGEVEVNRDGSSTADAPQIKTLKASDIVNLDDAADMEIVALGGKVLITAKNIDIGDGAVITSKKNEGDSLADVHILAADKGGDLIASRNASVTIGESLIEGKNVTIEAQAENKYDFEEIKEDQLEDLAPLIEELKGYYNDPSTLADIDLSNIDFKEVLSADYLLSLFDINDLFQGLAILTDGVVNGGLAKSDVNAKVAIGGGAVIKADENLDVKSSAFSQTTMKMSADGVSAALGWNESLSKISIDAASLFAGKDVNITAKNEILSDLSSVTGAYDIGGISGNAVTALSFTDSQTSVNINKDAAVNAGRSVQVNAVTEKNISIAADAPKTDNYSNIGIAAIYNNSDSKNSILIDGAITAAEDIKVTSTIVSNTKEQTGIAGLKAREEALTARNEANRAEKDAVISEEIFRQAKETEEKTAAELETSRQKLDELINNNASQEDISAASAAVTVAEHAHNQAEGVCASAEIEAGSFRAAADTAKTSADEKEQAAELANREMAIAAAVIYDDSSYTSDITVGANASVNAGKNVDIKSDTAVNSEIAAKSGSTKIGDFSGNAVTALSFSDVSTKINIDQGASIKASENVNIAAKTENNNIITADAPFAATASNAGIAVIYNDSSVDSKVSLNSDIKDIGGDIKIVSETDSKNTLTTAVESIQAQKTADEAFKNADTALVNAALAEENLKQAKENFTKAETSLAEASDAALAAKTALEEIHATAATEEIAAAERKFAVADEARQHAESAKNQAAQSVKQAESSLGQAIAVAEYAKTVYEQAQLSADKANTELAITGTVVFDRNFDESSINAAENVNLKTAGNIFIDAKANQESDIAAKTGSLDFGGVTGNAVTAFSINKTKSNIILEKNSYLEAGKDVNVTALSGKKINISADSPVTEETLNIGIAAIYNDSETDSGVLLGGNITAGENVNIEAKNEVKRTESSAALVLQSNECVKEAEINAKEAEEKSVQSAKTASEAAKAAAQAEAAMKEKAKEAENDAASLKEFMADYEDVASTADFLEKYEYLKEVLAFEGASNQQISSVVDQLETAVSNMKTELQSLHPEANAGVFDASVTSIQAAKQAITNAAASSDTAKEAAKNAGVDKAEANQAKILTENAKEREAEVNKKLAVTAGIIYDKSRETASVSHKGADAVNINAGKKISVASVNSSSADMTGKGTAFGISINDAGVKTKTVLNNVNLVSYGTDDGDGVSVSAESFVNSNVFSQSDSFAADTDINLGATVSLILSENDTSVDITGGSINSAKDVNIKAQTVQNVSSSADADTSLGLSVAFMNSNNKNAVNIDTDITAGGDLNAKSVIDIQKKETKAVIDSRMVQSGGVEREDPEEGEFPVFDREDETAGVNAELASGAQKAMDKGTSVFEGRQEGSGSGGGKISEDDEVLGMIEDLSMVGAAVYAENKDSAEINIGKNSSAHPETKLTAGNDINIGSAILKTNGGSSSGEKASVSSVADSAGVAVTVSKSIIDSSVNLGNAFVEAGNNANIDSVIKVDYEAKANAGKLVFGETFEGGAAVAVSKITTDVSVDTDETSKIKAAGSAKVNAVTEKDVTVSADANAGIDSNVAVSVVVSDSDSSNKISLGGDIEAGKDVTAQSKIITGKNEISAKASAGVEAAKDSQESLRQARNEAEWAQTEVTAYELIEQEAGQELEAAITEGDEAAVKTAEAKVKLAQEALENAKKNLETKQAEEAKLAKKVKAVDQTAIAAAVIYADNTENSNVSVGNVNILAGSNLTIDSSIDKSASVISDSEGISVAIANNKTVSKVDLNDTRLASNGKDSGKVSIISDTKIKADMSSAAGTFNVGAFEGSAAVAISDVYSDTSVNISPEAQIIDEGYLSGEGAAVKEAAAEIKAKTEKDISVISKASVSEDSQKTTVGLGLSLSATKSKNAVNIAGDIKTGGDLSIVSAIDTKNNTAQSTALREKETSSDETDNKGNTKSDRENSSENTAKQAMENADKQINGEMDDPDGGASESSLLPTVTVNKELKESVSIAGTVVYAENEEISGVNITGTSLRNVELESKNIEIISSVTNNAAGKTEASGIAVTVTDNVSQSSVNMTDVTVKASDEAKIKSETVINAVSEAFSGSLTLGGSFEGGAATAIASINSNTSVELSDNSSVSAENGVKIEALTKKSITETAEASTGNTSNVGVGVVYSDTYSENTVTISGDISADSGNVEIVSGIETVKNDITAKASVGEVTKKEEALRDAKNALADEEKNLEEKQQEIIDFERIVESIQDISGFADAYKKAKDLLNEAIEKKDAAILVKAYEEIEKARGYLQGPVEELAAADWQKLAETFDTLKGLIEAAAANPNEETLKALYDAFDPSKTVLEAVAGDVENVVDIAAVKPRETLAEEESDIKKEIEAKKVIADAAQADYDALADRDLAIAGAVIYADDKDFSKIAIGKADNSQLNINAGKGVSVQSQITKDTKILGEADGISVVMTNNKSDSDVSLNNVRISSLGTQEGSGVKIEAGAKVTSEVKADTGSFNIKEFEGSAGAALASTETNVSVDLVNGTKINSANDAEISAKTEKSTSVEVESRPGAGANIGLGFALNKTKSGNHVNLYSDIAAGGSINVSSVIESEKNDTKVHASSGNMSETEKKLEAGGAVIYASQKDDASVEADGVTLEAGKDLNVTVLNSGNVSAAADGAGASAAILENTADSALDIVNSKLYSGNNANISSEMKVKSLTDSQSGTLTISKFEGGAAAAVSTVKNSNNINLNNVEIEAVKDVSVKAVTEKDISVSASAKTGKTSNMGVGVAYSDGESNNGVYIKGKITAASINALSEINSVNNNVTVFASTGEGASESSSQSGGGTADKATSVKTDEIDKAVSETETNQNSGLADEQGGTKNKIAIGAAVGYTTQSNTARINVESSELSALRDIDISAKVTNAGINNDVEAAVKNSAGFSGAGAVLYGKYGDAASAAVNNSSLDAGSKINVTSAHLIPFTGENWMDEFKGKDLSNIEDLLELGKLAGKKAEEDFDGINDGLVNSWVRSLAVPEDEGETKVSAAGAVNLSFFDFTSEALVNNSRINQKTDSAYRTGNQSVNVFANSDTTFVNAGGIFGDSYKSPAGQSGAATGVGGTYNQITYQTDTKAAITGADTKVYANDLSLGSEYVQNDITAGVAGGESEKFAFQGVFNWVDSENKVDAYIDGAEEVTVEKGGSESGGTLNVSAGHDASLFNVAGSVSLSEKAAVGISAALNEISRHTNAYISNITSLKSGKTNIGAINEGIIHSYSVAASIASSKTEAEQPEQSETPESDSYVDNDSYRSGGSGDSGAFGLGISGSASINNVHGEANAYIANTIMEGGDSLSVKAVENSAIAAGSGGAALSLDTEGSGSAIAGAAGINLVDNQARAYISGSEINNKGKTEIEAESGSSVISVAAGLAGSMAKNGVEIAGSATVNITNNEVSAHIENSDIVTEADIFLNAKDKSKISSLAGAAGIGFNSVGIGAAVGVNLINNTVSSHINKSDVNVSYGKISLNSLNESKIETLGAAVGVVSGALGAAVSVAVNNIGNKTEAYISGKKDSDGKITAEDMTVTAEDISSINGLAGEISAADKAGIGAAVGVNRITNETKAYIENADINSLRNINLQALSDSTVKFIIAALGGGASAGVVGGVGINSIGNTAKAGIYDSDVYADGSISVFTQNSDLIQLISGAVAFGGTVGVGGNAGLNYISNKSMAEIVNSDVTALGKHSISGISGLFVKSNIYDKIEVYNAAAAGAGSAAVAGGITGAVIENESSARIKDSKINKDNAQAQDSQNVSVLADNTIEVCSYGGAVAGAGTVGIGIAADFLTLNNKVEAAIANSAVNAKNDIDVKTSSKEKYDLALLAGAGSGGVSVAGSVSVVQSDIKNNAYISDSITLSGGNTSVEAADEITLGDGDLGLAVGSAAGGLYAGAAGAVFVGSITNKTNALIKDSNVNAGKNLSVLAGSVQKIKATIPSLGGGIVGAGLTASVISLNTKTSALADGTNTELTSGQDINIEAENKLKLEETLIGIGGGFAGVGASAAVGNINNNVSAGIGNNVKASSGKDVNVNAQNYRDITSAVISAAGGFVGANGSVAVFTIGGNINSNDDAKENTEGYNEALNSAISRSGDYNEENAGNGGLTSGYIADMDKLDMTAEKLYGQTEINNGTTAFIGKGAQITSGNDINVNADDTIKFDSTAGGASGGFVGVGASVNIADITTLASAYIDDGAILKADSGSYIDANGYQIENSGSGSINVTANNLSDINMDTFIATGGFVAVNAGVSILDIADNSSARIGDSVQILRTKDVNISANSNSEIDTSVDRATIGAAATGATILTINRHGKTEALTGDELTVMYIPLEEDVYFKVVDRADVNLDCVDYEELYHEGMELTDEIKETLEGMGIEVATPEELKNYVLVYGNEMIEQDTASPVNKFSVKAVADSNITSKSLSGNSGAASVHADIFDIKSDDKVTASIGKNADILAKDSIDVITDGNVSAKADFLGVSLAGANIGVATANVELKFDNNAYIGEYDKDTSGGYNIISENINVIASQKANADVKTAIANLSGIDISGNEASTYIGGDVNSVIGKSNHFAANNMVLSANAHTSQAADADMYQVGGIVIGAGLAKSEANVNVKSEIQDGVHVLANNAFNVRTDLHNKMYSETESGRAALISAGGAFVNTKNNSTNSIIIGSDESDNKTDIKALNFSLSANTGIDQDSKTSASNVSLANGAMAKNKNFSDSAVSVGVYGKTDILANNIYIESLNKYVKNENNNANTKSSGLSGLNLFVAESVTDINLRTKIDFGKDTDVSTFKDKNNMSSFIIDAANDINARERADYISFSLLDGSEIRNRITNNSAAEINFNGNIKAASNLTASAHTEQDIRAYINANVLSAGILFKGDSSGNSNITNTINVNRGADIFAARNLYLYLSQDYNGMSSFYNTSSAVEAYLSALIPLDNSNSKVNSTVTDKLNIEEGGNIKASETIEVGAHSRLFYGEGSLNVYKLWLYFLQDADYKISANKTFNSLLEVNGGMYAGYNNNIFVNINGIYGEDNFNIDNNGSRESVGYTIHEDIDFQNDLYDELDMIEAQLQDYDKSYDNRPALEAEKAKILFKMSFLGLAIDIDGHYVVRRYSLDSIEFDPIHIGIGDIRINMDNLYGTGIISAADAPKVVINNNSSLFMKFNDITILNDNDATGKIYKNKVLLTGISDIEKLNTDKSLNAGFNEFSFGTGDVTSQIVINSDQASLGLDPDSGMNPNITFSGDVTNNAGLVFVNADGDIYLNGRVGADDLRIESKNGSIIQSYWNDGYVFHLSDPRQMWKSVVDANEALYTGEPIFVLDYDNKAVKFLLSLFGQDYIDKNYDKLVKKYAKREDSDFTGEVKSNDPVDDKTYSSMIANNIFISGRYLDINGLIQAGRMDYCLDIADNDLLLNLYDFNGKTVTGTIADAEAYYANSSVSKSKNSLFALADEHGNVNAYYDVISKEIIVDDLYVKSGGKLELYGQIINTSSSSGELKALDGYSRFNIDNNSGFTINLKNVNLSEKATGQIKITDLAYNFGTSEDPFYLETIYTFNGTDIVKTDNTTVDENGKGNNIEILSGRDASYATREGQRYYWAEGNSAYEESLWQKVTEVESFLGYDWMWGSSSINLDGYSLQSFEIKDEFPLSRPEYVDYGNAVDLLYEFYYQRVNIDDPDIKHLKTIIKDRWTGLFNTTKVTKITERAIRRQGIYNYYTNSIKADNPVKIGFIGYETPQDLTVSSKSDIHLTGALNAGASADIMLTSKGAIENAGNGNIAARNIILNASNGIGNNLAVNISLKGGSLTAINDIAGNINIYAKTAVDSYDTKINNITNNGTGSIILESDNNIISVSENGIIKGNSVELISNMGYISGFAGEALNIDTGIIKALARDNISLVKKTFGDLKVGRIESYMGDVYLEAQGGNILNNSVISINDKKRNESEEIWTELDLYGAGGWDENKLLYTLKKAGESEDFNIIGNTVNIKASGSIGSDIESFSFKVSEFESLTDRQKDVLFAAGYDSLNITGEGSDMTFEVTARDDLTVYAKNGMNLNAGANIMLGGRENINIISAAANGDINIKGSKGIYNASDEHIANLSGNNIIIESLNSDIGLADKALCVDALGVVTAKAKENIDIHFHGGNTFINTITAGSRIALNAEGNIVSNDTSINNIIGHNINITAGNIGTADNNINFMLVDNKDSSENKLINLSANDGFYINSLGADNDIVIGAAKAKNNAIINSENGNILAFDKDSYISANNIEFNAKQGNIGSSDNKLKVTDFELVSGYAKENIDMEIIMPESLNIEEDTIRHPATSLYNIGILKSEEGYIDIYSSDSAINLQGKIEAKENITADIYGNITDDMANDTSGFYSGNINLISRKGSIGNKNNSIRTGGFKSSGETRLNANAQKGIYAESADTIIVSDVKTEKSDVKIESEKDIKAEKQENGASNITAQNIELKSGGSIGEKDNRLITETTKEKGKVNVEAENDIYIKQNGSSIFYSDYMINHNDADVSLLLPDSHAYIVNLIINNPGRFRVDFLNVKYKKNISIGHNAIEKLTIHPVAVQKDNEEEEPESSYKLLRGFGENIKLHPDLLNVPFKPFAVPGMLPVSKTDETNKLIAKIGLN